MFRIIDRVYKYSKDVHIAKNLMLLSPQTLEMCDKTFTTYETNDKHSMVRLITNIFTYIITVSRNENQVILGIRRQSFKMK